VEVEGEEGEGIEGRKRPRHIAGSSIDEIVLTWAQCAKKGLLFVLKSAKAKGVTLDGQAIERRRSCFAAAALIDVV
jgi:hypothetical protein